MAMCLRIVCLMMLAGVAWGGMGEAGEAMREVWTYAICGSSLNQTRLDVEEGIMRNMTPMPSKEDVAGMVREKCARCFLNITQDQVLTKYGGKMSMNCSRTWLGEEYEECNQLIQDGEEGNDVLACFQNTLYKVETSKCLEEVDESDCFFCSTDDADRFMETADCMKNKVRKFKKYMKMMVLEKVIGDSGCGFPAIIGMKMMAGMQRGKDRLDVDDFIDSLMEGDKDDDFMKPKFRPPINGRYGRPYPKGPYYNQNRPYYSQNRPNYNQNRPYYRQNQPYSNSRMPYNNQNRPYYNQNRPNYIENEAYDKRLPREYYGNEEFTETADGWVTSPSGVQYKTGDLDYSDICSRDAGCSWSQAKAVCEQEGGILAIPISQQEASFVARVVAPWKGKSWFYIGLTDELEEGSWTYVSNYIMNSPRVAKFTNWFGNEPNSYNGMDEDCAFVSPNHGGGWGDIGCNVTSIPAWGLTMLPLCQREGGNDEDDLMDLFG